MSKTYLIDYLKDEVIEVIENKFGVKEQKVLKKEERPEKVKEKVLQSKEKHGNN